MADPSLLGLAGLGFDCHGSGDNGEKPFVGAAALYRLVSYGKTLSVMFISVCLGVHMSVYMPSVGAGLCKWKNTGRGHLQHSTWALSTQQDVAQFLPHWPGAWHI